MRNELSCTRLDLQLNLLYEDGGEMICGLDLEISIELLYSFTYLATSLFLMII